MGPGYEVSIKEGGSGEGELMGYLDVSKGEDKGEFLIEQENDLRGDWFLAGESLLRETTLNVGFLGLVEFILV